MNDKDDSLAAAIAGTQRGERWEDADGRVLNISKTGYVSVGTEQLLPSLTSWHRVDAPVLCPRCGKESMLEVAVSTLPYYVQCPHCGLRDGTAASGRYATEAEAVAAWKRIGKPQWHRPEEKPKRKRWYVCWWADCIRLWKWIGTTWLNGDGDEHKPDAWMDMPEPPEWVKGGSDG